MVLISDTVLVIMVFLFSLQCKSCKNPPVGDYYEYKKVNLCRKCYKHHLRTGEKYTKRQVYFLQLCINHGKECTGTALGHIVN